MPNIQSTGVFVTESDFSQRTQQLGQASFLCLGGATKGPLDKPLRISSEAELIRKFGPPVLDDYGLHAALRFLRRGNNLWYLRVGAKDPITGASQADVPVPGVAGGSAAVAATGSVTFNAQLTDGQTITVDDGTNPATAPLATITLTGAANPSDTETVTITDGIVATPIVFEFDNNATITGNVAVAIGVDAIATLAALKLAIEASALNVTVTTTTGAGDPQLTLTHGIVGVSHNGDAVTSAAVAVAVTVFAGGTASISAVTFEFDDNGAVTGTNTSVLIGATLADTASSLSSAIAAAGLTFNVTTNLQVTNPTISLANTTASLIGNIPITTTAGASLAILGMSGGLDVVVSTSNANVITFRANTAGTWGNNVRIVVQNTTQVGGTGKDVLVYAVKDATIDQTRQIVERYVNVTLDVADGNRYLENLVEVGVNTGFPTSRYVVVDVHHNGSIMANGTYDLGSGGGSVGRNGIAGLADADYVGTNNGALSTGLQAAANPEMFAFNVVAIPGNTNKIVIDGLIAFCESLGNCQGYLDTPMGLSKQQVIDWHNGLDVTTPQAPIKPIDSSFVAIFWPWKRDYDPYSKTFLWLPPSGFVAGTTATSFEKASPTRAIAGHRTGGVDGLELEYSATQNDRADLTRNGNRVNAIVEFAVGSNPGYYIYGNSTALRKDTMLASLNVRNGLTYAETLCANATRILVFDPNHSATWLEFQDICNRELESVAALGGFSSLRVICDATTNPPDQVRDRRMEAKLLVAPVLAAETLVLNFGVFESGADFDESLIV